MESTEYVAPTAQQIADDIPVLWIAPQAVKDAWCEHSEYTEVAFFPEGYMTMDSCGCCFNNYPPGWYLGEIYRTLTREYVVWTGICAPDGGPIAPPHYFDILDSD